MQIISPLPLPVTGSVGVNGPVQIQQSGTWTFNTQLPLLKRYGPTFASNQTSAVIVPAIAASTTFVATYIHVSGISNNSAVPTVSGYCVVDATIAGSTSWGFNSAAGMLKDAKLAALIERGHGWPWNGYELLQMKAAGNTIRNASEKVVGWRSDLPGRCQSACAPKPDHQPLANLRIPRALCRCSEASTMQRAMSCAAQGIKSKDVRFTLTYPLYSRQTR